MFQEIFIALFKAGLPVGVVAYLLVWWALRNGRLKDVATLKDVEKEMKRQSKDKETKKEGDVVHRKWLATGGGFYGVVAVLTWVYIEIADVLDFFAQFDGFGDFASLFSISMLISLILEALMNSFYAFAWPFYWMSDINSNFIWIWFIAAYAGYWLGSNLAMRQFSARSVTPE